MIVNDDAGRSESRGLASLVLVASVLYFSEGLPFGFITELLPLYLRANGVSLAEIGLLSTVGLAWTAKLFWSPLLDRFGSYRAWIIGCLSVLTLTWVVFAVATPLSGYLFWATVTLMAIASATQDIAIDAQTITITPRPALGAVNSARVAAYRIAIIAAGGGLAAVGGGDRWWLAFAIGAGATALLLLWATTLPSPVRELREHQPLFRGLRAWLARPGAGSLIAVVLLYKLGDAALLPMIKPFWVDRGHSPAEIGTVTTTAGMILTIAGAVAGGAFITRFGLFFGLLHLGILQMLSNAGYALAAVLGGGRALLYPAAFVESFCGGLGTAAFLAFLMAICDRRYAATEYALLSALFGLTRSLIGMASGITAQTTGYAVYFWITLALGFPGLVVLLRARARIEARS
ncbi:MAG TPA: MFS transporter [Thermoanaerobaculia bacterium]|nr:MFS transporter [Thermoanaerobaculia bacterium]